MDHQNSSFSPGQAYQAYLLRIWRELPDGRWRLTLEDPHTDERHAFNNVDLFIQFLLDMTETEEHQEDVKHTSNAGGKKRSAGRSRTESGAQSHTAPFPDDCRDDVEGNPHPTPGK